MREKYRPILNGIYQIEDHDGVNFIMIVIKDDVFDDENTICMVKQLDLTNNGDINKLINEEWIDNYMFKVVVYEMLEKSAFLGTLSSAASNILWTQYQKSVLGQHMKF